MPAPIIPDSVIPINPNMFGPRAQKGKGSIGKRVVFVTPHRTAAEETKRKYEEKFYKVEIEKEKDDAGKLVFVVYIL